MARRRWFSVGSGVGRDEAATSDQRLVTPMVDGRGSIDDALNVRDGKRALRHTRRKGYDRNSLGKLFVLCSMDASLGSRILSYLNFTRDDAS